MTNEGRQLKSDTNAAVVVFGVHLSAQSNYWVDIRQTSA